MDNRIPPDICDAALRELNLLSPMDAGIMESVDKTSTDHATRKATLKFAPPWFWFGGILNQAGLRSNVELGWGFIIDGFQDVQYAEYGVGGHYKWHIDTYVMSGAPKDRKVTVICLLNDPREFEGGQLEIKNVDVTPMKKGDVVVFPSFIEHRVTPVTKGVRKTATMWLTGPAFR